MRIEMHFKCPIIFVGARVLATKTVTGNTEKWHKVHISAHLEILLVWENINIYNFVCQPLYIPFRVVTLVYGSPVA